MENKIKEQQQAIDEYNKAIERGFKLLDALEAFKGNTINKTFFEKYFTEYYTKENDYIPKGCKIGDARKDYRGNIYTEFSIRGGDYNFNKDKLQIFLAGSQKVDEIDNRTREHITAKTKDKIQLLKDWRDSAVVKRDKYKAFDAVSFKNDYIKLIEKYGMDGEEYLLRDIIR